MNFPPNIKEWKVSFSINLAKGVEKQVFEKKCFNKRDLFWCIFSEIIKVVFAKLDTLYRLEPINSIE